MERLPAQNRSSPPDAQV